jgi:integrase
MAKITLQTPTSRARLAPRGKPYLARLIPGVHLGYRAAQSGTGAWLVIASDGKGGQWQKVFAHADDKQPADGSAVLTYEQATHQARALARGDANAASARPASIGEALEAYEADLTARGRNAYNARRARLHLPPHLAAQVLSTITTKQLRAWRDALVRGGMKPITVNRVAKVAKAAINLAASLDARVAANREAWRIGLAELPNAAKARDAVLTDAQVKATVAAAYAIGERVGVYVQAHAETGARSSQLAGCTVGDLVRDKLLVPHSRKGRGGGKGGHIAVPITASLAARLRRAAGNRPADAALFLRPDGEPWARMDHRRPFEQAARAAKLPKDATIYWLRHSSIVRMLLRNLPVKLAADLHDTSAAMIEKHYGRWIKHHADELVRSTLLDTTPAMAAVVPLRRA